MYAVFQIFLIKLIVETHAKIVIYHFRMWKIMCFEIKSKTTLELIACIISNCIISNFGRGFDERIVFEIKIALQCFTIIIISLVIHSNSIQSLYLG